MRQTRARRAGAASVCLLLLLAVLSGCAKIGDVTWDCSKGIIRATIHVRLDSGGTDADWVRVTAWPGDDDPEPGAEFELGVNQDSSMGDDYPVTGTFPRAGTYTLKAWSALEDAGWNNGKTKVVTTCS